MRKSVFICAFMALAMAMGACSDDKKNDEKSCEGENCNKACEGDDCNRPGVSFVMTRSMDSVNGCTLDTDCVEGAFCFQGQCVVQCSKELGLNCDSDYVCQALRGRCVKQEYIEGLRAVNDEIEAAGDSMTDEEKNARLANYELTAKKKGMTDVVYSVLGQANGSDGTVDNVRIKSDVPYVGFVTGDTKTVNITAAEPLGRVQYAVRVEGMGLPVLKTAKTKANADGSQQYDFDIDMKAIQATRRLKSLLRNNSLSELDPVDAEIISSVGSYTTTLTKPLDAKGYYVGDVRPDSILSGAPLPIRMYLDVVPEKPESFDDITQITLYLPSSGADIFSPTAASDSIQWSFVKMTKETDPKKCLSQTKCFSAKFSSNDFFISNSKLIKPEHKLNRAMRVEFSDFDSSNMKFYGVLKDNVTGLYRESAIEDGVLKRNWNITDMQGELSVVLNGHFDDSLTGDDKKPPRSIRRNRRRFVKPTVHPLSYAMPRRLRN